MKKVFRVAGLSAKVADCIGAKPVVVSGKPLPRERQERIDAKRSRNSDVMDLFEVLGHSSFNSAIPAHRCATSHKLSSAVCLR